jgi:uncharacterized protein (AIM24 family)
MQYKILKEPMAMLEIQLNNEEQVTAEAGAMVYIKGNIEVKSRCCWQSIMTVTILGRTILRSIRPSASFISKGLYISADVWLSLESRSEYIITS